MAEATATPCPGEETLAEFAAGALAQAQVPSIEAHLDFCGDCSRLVGRLIGDSSAAKNPGSEEAAGAGGSAAGGSAAGARGFAAADSSALRAGKVAQYLLREVVGSGGMGTVYEAEDVRLGRRVALKLLREDGPARAGRGERFLREARITAMLEHPNIVPVLEVGELEDGVPYYTQRLVRGRTLARALASCPDLAARLKLLPHFLDVCHAIAYAHRQGVIHRDIKPGNVMVGPFGETVVVDWGLARLRSAPQERSLGSSLGSNLGTSLGTSLGTIAASSIGAARAPHQTPSPGLTVEGQAVGTPGYMSPEQAAGRLDEVDERSDVFCLGAVLFEILVGRAPFLGQSDEERLRKAISEPMPEAQGAGVPPDLAAVAAKALSHDPSLRYADAAAMEAEVLSWSEGRLVTSYRYSAFQRLQRFSLRHRAASASLLFTLLVTGAFLGSVWGRRVEQSRQRATDLIAKGLAYSRLLQWDRSALYFASARLEDDRPRARWGLAALGQSGLVPLYKLRRHGGPVREVAFSPDGTILASASDDRTLRFVEPKSGREIRRIDLAAPPKAFVFSPDGGRLACALERSVELYGVQTGARGTRFTMSEAVRDLAFSRDGKLLAASAGGEVRVWDLASSREVGRASSGSGPIDSIAFLPSGELVFSGGMIAGVHRWDPSSPVAPALFGPSSARVPRLATCATGQLVVLDANSGVSLWRPEADGKERKLAEALPLQTIDCRSLSVSSDCGSLVCVGEVGNLRITDIGQRVSFAALAGSFRVAVNAALSPDGSLLAVGSGDHGIRLWSIASSHTHSGFRGEGVHPSALAWSGDGKLLVSADRAGTLQLWDPATGKPLAALQAHDGPARAVAFGKPGGVWASAGADGVRLWDLGVDSDHSQPALVARPPLSRPIAAPTASLAFSSSGELLAAGGEDGSLRLLSLASGAVAVLPAHKTEVRVVALSRDATRLASGGLDGTVLLWDPAARKLLARLEGHDDEVRALAFSPDGRFLVSGSADRTLRVWDATTGRALGQLDDDFAGEVDALSFAPLVPGAPAAGLLLSSSWPTSIYLWDVERKEMLLALTPTTAAALSGLTFSPDARRAALLRSDGLLLMQDLSGPERLKSPREDFAELMRYYKYERAGTDFVRDEAALIPPSER